MQKADTDWYRRRCHGLYLFSFSWVTHKDDVLSAEQKVSKERSKIYSEDWSVGEVGLNADDFS